MSWNFKKEEKYTLCTPVNSSEEELTHAFGLLDFTDHKILDCSGVRFTEGLRQVVSKNYEDHLEQQKSFIVVVESKELMEDLEDFFVVVPTISEAIDYLYMEELERNILE